MSDLLCAGEKPIAMLFSRRQFSDGVSFVTSPNLSQKIAFIRHVARVVREELGRG